MSPEQLLEQISALSSEYYDKCEEMGSISERKGYMWLELRAQCKTNGETDQKWAATADGRRENYLKFYLKGLSAKRSSLILRLKADQGAL